MQITKEVKNVKTLMKKTDGLSFFVDDQSNLRPDAIGKPLPMKFVEMAITIQGVTVFETDEKDSYIIRRSQNTYPEWHDDLISHKKKILNVFPEITKIFESAEVKSQDDNCSGCGKNAAKKSVIQAMQREYGKKERELDSLEGVLHPRMLAMIKGDPIHNIDAGTGKFLMAGPRPVCKDCARKHIAQAIVLIGESLLGYPQHRWLAIGHLAEASEEMVAEYPAVAHTLRTERLKLMADPKYNPSLMELIEQISEIEEKENGNDTEKDGAQSE